MLMYCNPKFLGAPLASVYTMSHGAFIRGNMCTSEAVGVDMVETSR